MREEIPDVLEATAHLLVLEVHPGCHPAVEDVPHIAFHATVLRHGSARHTAERGVTESVVGVTEQRPEGVDRAVAGIGQERARPLVSRRESGVRGVRNAGRHDDVFGFEPRDLHVHPTAMRASLATRRESGHEFTTHLVQKGVGKRQVFEQRTGAIQSHIEQMVSLF